MENLVLENYGITLRLLTHDKLELLRQWRNDPKIQQYMFYREHITQEMQERWFAKLDKQNNLYFFIEVPDTEGRKEGRKAVGVINVKDVDQEKRTGEIGIFIYDESCRGVGIAFKSHLVMLDYLFDTLQLKTTYLHILPDNSKSYRLYESLGARLNKEKTTADSLFYDLTAADYKQGERRCLFLQEWGE